MPCSCPHTRRSSPQPAAPRAAAELLAQRRWAISGLAAAWAALWRPVCGAWLLVVLAACSSPAPRTDAFAPELPRAHAHNPVRTAPPPASTRLAPLILPEPTPIQSTPRPAERPPAYAAAERSSPAPAYPYSPPSPYPYSSSPSFSPSPAPAPVFPPVAIALPDTADLPGVLAAVDASALLAQGRASWYGPRFHGRRTASGERYDMHALTAAHKTLPLGSRVRVRSVHTGKEVVVRINDRGPYKNQRIIDLSYAAAKALGVKERGVTEVLVLRE